MLKENLSSAPKMEWLAAQGLIRMGMVTTLELETPKVTQ